MTIQNEIKNIDKRIEELRKDYAASTPAWKKFIVANVKLLKERQARLQKQVG